uniref:Lysosome-associated membrane glycoprotein 2 n=1 Tax=Rhabditophanes sp. KR3021 TaxID=114890 RepID=A0AC35UG94_9BILA
MKSLILILSVIGLASASLFYTQDPTTKKYCVLLESEISGKINYKKNGTEVYSEYMFDIPASATSTGGSCMTTTGTQLLQIDFFPNDEKTIDKKWSLMMQFKGNSEAEQSQSFQLISYNLHVFGLTLPLFNGTDDTHVFNSTVGNEWEAGETNGFACSSNTLKFKEGPELVFRKIKLVAEVEYAAAAFPKSLLFENCKLDSKTSDLLPIIVGAVLSGLVVLVLVAYLIGRQRAKRQGYASV